MDPWYTVFWLCFVPAFVAVDAIGVLPFYIGLTEGLADEHRRHIVRQSVLTAAAVAVLFLFGGAPLLALLGVTVPDFMIAGGALLFVISMSDILRDEKAHRRIDPDSVGAVPIGVPLITGPAVLTTCILLTNQHGLLWPSTAVVLNILIAGIIFSFAAPIHRVLGKSGSRTISKIASLLLAAIAVMFIRKGLIAFLPRG